MNLCTTVQRKQNSNFCPSGISAAVIYVVDFPSEHSEPIFGGQSQRSAIAAIERSHRIKKVSEVPLRVGGKEGRKEGRKAPARRGVGVSVSVSLPPRLQRYLCALVVVRLKKRGICCHHNITSICDLPPLPSEGLFYQRYC